MLLNSVEDIMQNISFVVGSREILLKMESQPTKTPFLEEVINFFDEFSKRILSDLAARMYSDMITYAFWIRRSNVMQMKSAIHQDGRNIKCGRGVVFHIAPSNIPLNYMYSFTAGMLAGNVNIVRVPSKQFPQIEILNQILNEILQEYTDLEQRMCFIKYGHDKKITDKLSELADARVIWGGDSTISEIRKSPIKPRTVDIAFADRFSIALIDADYYMEYCDKGRVARDFYNDTYMTDQNACTSPRLVVWKGKEIKAAKELFWKNLMNIVYKEYVFQNIQGINKLTGAFMLAAEYEGARIVQCGDNRLVRVEVDSLSDDLEKYFQDSGFFVEYECFDIFELKDICGSLKCQTIAYLGNSQEIIPLVLSGIKGVDRIVPIGHTMDFTLIWDGYDLFERMTKTVVVV